MIGIDTQFVLAHVMNMLSWVDYVPVEIHHPPMRAFPRLHGLVDDSEVTVPRCIFRTRPLPASVRDRGPLNFSPEVVLV